MILDLLRHGETEQGGGLRGSLDDALTDKGWGQMRDALEGAGPWDVLVSSPLQRCARFAEQLGMAVQLEADLQELHFGEWEGRSALQIMQAQADELGRFWANPYSYTPPAGEPVAAFAERVLAAVERLRQQQAHDAAMGNQQHALAGMLLAQALNGS